MQGGKGPPVPKPNADKFTKKVGERKHCAVDPISLGHRQVRLAVQDIKRIKQEGPGLQDVVLTYTERKEKPGVGEEAPVVEEVVCGYIPLDVRPYC